jgi:xanthine dehydrogenase YagS FAD-binding subunit
LSQSGAAALAGGTTLLDLMKIDVQTPTSVVDIQALPWKDIRVDDGALSVGALSSNTAVADHPS